MIIGYFAFLCIGIYALYLGIKIIKNIQSIEKEGIKTNAVVKDIDEKDLGKTNITTMEVMYRVESGDFISSKQTTTFTYANEHPINSMIEIVYLPSNPIIFQFVESNANTFNKKHYKLVIGFGAILIAVSIILMFITVIK